jgi:lipoprotein-anchoring transpeptidase ErfK/SrfK
MVALAALLLVGGTAGWALSAPATSQSFRRASRSRAATLAQLQTRPQPVVGDTLVPEWRPTFQTATPVQPPQRPKRSLLAAIEGARPITARPGDGRVVGTMPAGSRYYGTPHRAWILERSKNRRYGKVAVPYSGTRRTGWMRLGGLELTHTPIKVRADLSEHLIKVLRRDKVIMRFPAATGAPASPTPPGRYFVTDRVPFSPTSSLGAFAFGISGIQPRLPAGWGGGDQLAIHGTNDPSSIGRSVSAGCLRVSRTALERLKPLLRLGTPVVISG